MIFWSQRVTSGVCKRASEAFSAVALVLFTVSGCQAIAGLTERSSAKGSCIHNSDCAPNNVCLFEICSVACVKDVDCDAGARCLNTSEGAACVTSALASCESHPCPDGTTCSEGTCRTPCGAGSVGMCRSDQTCSAANVCIGTEAGHDARGEGGDGPIAVGGDGGDASGGGASAAGMSGSASGDANAGTSSGGVSGVAGSGEAGRSSSSGAGGTSSAGGSGGSAGAGGGKAPAQPSTGCTKLSPQTGSASSPLSISSHQYYVKLPTGYDATKPYPTMIMFNATANPISWAEQNAGFEATGPKENWIRVYPGAANSSSGWGAADVAFFQPFYDQITASFCIDKARVFAAGEDSGGDFASILGCEYADTLRAVAAAATKTVSAYPLTPASRNCKGQVTAAVIHGESDSVIPLANGQKTRDFYVALNHCSTTSPMPVAEYTDTLSNCVMYQQCDANYPVYWCQHKDPNYGGTNHGWPAFAPTFIYGLFSSY